MRNSSIAKFLDDQSGATAVEYALIILMISLAGIVGMTATGNVVGDPIQKAADGFK